MLSGKMPSAENHPILELNDIFPGVVNTGLGMIVIDIVTLFGGFALSLTTTDVNPGATPSIYTEDPLIFAFAKTGFAG
jgi:hypothetical protein